MWNTSQQELASEWNARYDDHAERYAGEKLDYAYESYCDECSARDHYGLPAISFAEFKAEALKPFQPQPFVVSVQPQAFCDPFADD